MAVSTLTVNKTPAGAQDIDWDTNGSGSQTSVPLSNGSFQIIERVNADHIPVTAGTRAKTDAAGTTITETSVDEVLQQLLTDNAAQGIPDNSTLEVSGGVLRVKDAGITAAKIATGAVGSDELATDSVTTTKIDDDAVTAAKLANDSVTVNKILDATIIGDKIAANTIENGNIAAATIKAAKLVDLPSHMVKYAGQYAYAGGSATVAITVTGVVATDAVFASVQSATTAALIIYRVTASANTITVTFNADPGAATVINYQALRAVTP